MKTIKEIEKEHKELELRKIILIIKRLCGVSRKEKYVEFLEQDYKKTSLINRNTSF